MKRLWIIFGLLLLPGLLPAYAGAAPVTAYVEPFSVVGAAGDAGLPATLQTLLSSRLSGESVQVQDSAKGARLLIKGTYIRFGRIFSIDVTARDAAGGVLARTYEQGEGEEAVLPAISRLAEKLVPLLTAARPQAQAAPAQAPPTATAPAPAVAVAAPLKAAPDIIKAEAAGTSGTAGVVGQRLTGVYIGLAPLRTLEGGERELYLLRERGLQVVRHGARTEQLAEVNFGPDEKALTVDSADLDGDGLPEAYLTVMRGEELASQVWIFKDNRLTRLADNLPYFFRSLAAPGGGSRLYAQQMGRSDDFYGPVYELKKGSKGFELQNPLKLPKIAHIFNFNRFADRDGNSRSVVLHPDGYLVVFSETGEELWRSNDKYGGSELYFSRDDLQNIRVTGSAIRKIFLEQRLAVTKGGELIVPQNSGFFVVGASRSFSKNSIFAFAWNGVALEERWRTRVSQNYLADYFLDEERKELILLEVVKKAGIMEKGASAVTIKRVE
ncbi:MAG: VCBS repeat-containing protein [Geobacteraceae bacterium]|nr:VCBS repeat-containing protein [Geobacteraceae bacterium]